MSFGEKILDYKEDILKDLDELLKIQSVSSKSQEDASEALKFILKRAEEMGLTTENVDDIAGHAEYGKGDEIAAVLSHVDVVPSGDGWSVEPFALTRKNGRLYGRGIADDKGPAIIALYCLKALKDSGVSFKRRLRTIFGASEEVGMADMDRYFSKQPLPNMGFTPDLEYGICNVEKGGGNVAMDAARSAKRLGAENVYIVYRRSMNELPARKEEVEHAEEEGIIFKTLTNPVEVIGDENGNVCGMKCVEMELGEPDESGRRRPVVKEGSELTLDIDTMIMSIGTSPNPLIRSTTPGLDTNKHGCIITDGEDGLTTREGVYAGGDAVTGAATVILAMGAGKSAAKAIDEYIKNKNS